MQFWILFVSAHAIRGLPVPIGDIDKMILTIESGDFIFIRRGIKTTLGICFGELFIKLQRTQTFAFQPKESIADAAR